MKWLFTMLLAVNVVYFGWELDRETRLTIRNSPPAVSLPATARPLQLISELDTPPDLRVSMEADIPAIAQEAAEQVAIAVPEQLVAELPDIQLAELENIATTSTCYKYGPVLDEELIEGLHDWFRSRNALAAVHYTDEQATNMFWVYLAPQPTRETAIAVLEDMRSKGIGDYRLINRGELVNAISLGLFSSRDAVDARLMELKDKGYVPVVVPYADVKRIYWLEVQVTSTSPAVEEMYYGYPVKFASVPVNCDTVSIGLQAP
jgi:hypothetical protein